MAAAATSPRRRSSPRARGCRDRATATPSASKRFAFALPKSRSRSRRISLSPVRLVLAAVARRRCGRAVVHFHGDVGQPAHRSPPRRTCAFPAGCPPCVSEIACCCDQAIITFAPSCRAIRTGAAADQGHEGAEPGVRADAREAAGSVCASTCRRPRASRSTARKPATRRASSSSQPDATASRSRRSAISRSAPTSTSKASARRRRSSRSSCRAGAIVTVTSEPAGAQLLVNGEPRGVTPLKAEIMAGAHPVELRLEGFKPWTTDIQVKANEPLALGPVKLGLPDGRLAVRSDPPGASVSVAGVYRGQTPLELELRPDLDHSIVLTRPGYEAVDAPGVVGRGRAAHAFRAAHAACSAKSRCARSRPMRSCSSTASRAAPRTRRCGSSRPRTRSRSAKPASSISRPASRRVPACSSASRRRC